MGLANVNAWARGSGSMRSMGTNRPSKRGTGCRQTPPFGEAERHQQRAPLRLSTLFSHSPEAPASTAPHPWGGGWSREDSAVTRLSPIGRAKGLDNVCQGGTHLSGGSRQRVVIDRTREVVPMSTHIGPWSVTNAGESPRPLEPGQLGQAAGEWAA